MEEDLQNRIEQWKEIALTTNDPRAIPEDFYSDEDSDDRNELWREYQDEQRQQRIAETWDDYTYHSTDE